MNNRHPNLALLCSLSLALISFCASAQVVLDVHGELSSSDQTIEDSHHFFDDYYYDGQAGERLAVALFSEAFDVILIVLDPEDGLLLQEDDSAGHDLNVFVELTLPVTGRYLLAVTSTYSGQTGAYRLTVGDLRSVEGQTGIRSGLRSTVAAASTTLSGTLFAPQGGSVEGSIVIACFEQGDGCDRARSGTYEVSQAGASANFTISGLEAGRYSLFAVKDNNSNGVLGDEGDYLAVYGSDGYATAPAQDLWLPMVVVEPHHASTARPYANKVQDLGLGMVIGGGSTTPGPQPDLEPFIVKGRVTDMQGRPMAGVEVFADNTLGYNANIFGITDADGYYRIDVSGVVPSSWRIGAHHKVTYHGVTYTFSLHPDNASPLVGIDGAIRNLQWRLTGETPTGGFYGGLVRVYEDYMAYDLDIRYVELTFTPEGPLVDGSVGSSFSLSSASGMDILDVPVGHYTISARYQPPGAAPSAVLIRIRDQGDYAASTTALIRPHDLYGLLLELQVKKAP